MTYNKRITHASLFSGIGGFDLAAIWMGWQNIFWCENDPFCRRVLKYHFKDSIGYDNIKETDFTKHRGQIDILTGGFPCQPFSDAGLKGGTSDPRYLWPDMLRAVREIRPEWVIAENVRGLISWNAGLVFDTVCTDLENEGYKVIPCLLPACGVNAPHQRYRIWFVAYRTDSRPQDSQQEQAERMSKAGTTADPNSIRSIRRSRNCDRIEKTKTFGTDIFIKTNGFSEERTTSNPSSYRSKKRGKIGTSKISVLSSRFDGFPTQSPICFGNDGVYSRLDDISFSSWRKHSIKGLGNAIVPQVALQIFKTIISFNHETDSQ